MKKTNKVLSLLMTLLIIISIGSPGFTTQAATMPSCTSPAFSKITTNSVRVDFKIKNPSNLKVKTCGMQIRMQGTSSWSGISETVNSSYQKASKIPVWYTVGKGKEFNITLSSNTTYECRGFCKYSGSTYYSSTKTFKTQATTKMPSCNSLKVSSVTTNSARVDFNIYNPSSLTVKTCGMQLRKQGVSSWSTIRETVNSSYQKSTNIPVWYTVGSGKEFNVALSANTTYECRGFCEYNGSTYYTSTSTFKTQQSSAPTNPGGSLPAEKLKALKKKYPEGSASSNCYTYATKAFKYLYSRNAVQKKTGLSGETAWKNIKVGDVVHYYKSKSDPDYKYGNQHWVFVIAKTDTKITIAEGNYKGTVHYGRKINKSKFTNGNYYNVEIRR